MSSTLDDIRDVRQRAAAILSGRKLKMLEDAGLTVVDKRRLEALERVAKAAKKYRTVEIYAHPLVPDEDWDYNDAMNALGEAEREFDSALAALEAMECES